MEIEKPIVFASEAPSVLTPTTSPLRFTSGPPELPGLIAASVWIRLYNVGPGAPDCPAGPWAARPSGPPTPAVTGGPPGRPSPFPIATTHSPLRRLSELPSATVGN